MIRALGKRGMPERVLQPFVQIQQDLSPTVSLAWQSGDPCRRKDWAPDRALQPIDQMQQQGLKPDVITYAAGLR